MPVPQLQVAGNGQHDRIQSTGNRKRGTSNYHVKPEIVFDDFAKIDLKVGTIVSAEKVTKG